MTPPLSPVAAELRAARPERFLTALFAPPDRREAIMALAAFEAATAKATLATQELAGLGRLAFWRDVVAGAGAARPVHHPVADALAAAIRDHALPPSAFLAHLSAREALLAATAFPDLPALAAHAGEVGAPMLALACRVLGCPPPAGHRAAAEALELVALLREAVPLARVGRLALPQELCTEAGFGVQGLAEGRDLSRIAAVVEPVAEAAALRLAAAGRIPRAAVPAFLPLVPARQVLAALARAGHDPAAAVLWQPGTATRLRVLAAALSGRP